MDTQRIVEHAYFESLMRARELGFPYNRQALRFLEQRFFAAQALTIILAEPADGFPSLDLGVYQEVQKVLSGWRLKH